MKTSNFEKLMKGTVYERKPEIETDHDEVFPLYNDKEFDYIDGDLAWPCKSCEELSKIDCEPEEFNEEFHYCGRSDSCCP